MKLNKNMKFGLGVAVFCIPLLSGCVNGNGNLTKTIKDGATYYAYSNVEVVNEELTKNSDSTVTGYLTIKNNGGDYVVPSGTRLYNYQYQTGDPIVNINYYWDEEVVKDTVVFPGETFKVKIENFTSVMKENYLNYIQVYAFEATYNSLKTINNPNYQNTISYNAETSTYSYDVSVPEDERYFQNDSNKRSVKFTTLWTISFNGESKVVKMYPEEKLTLLSKTTTFEKDEITIQKVEYLNYSGTEESPLFF